MPTPVAPKLDLKSFTCPHCGVLSQHDWRYVLSGAHSEEGHALVLASPSDLWGEDTTWMFATCGACDEHSFWRGAEMVWPMSAGAVAPPHDELTEPARGLYIEARAVLPHSRRAAAALIRASLERLLREVLEEPGGRLHDLIATAHTRVSVPLWRMLTAVRVLGNTTLHEDDDSELVTLYLGDDDASTAEPYFWTVNAVVEELIERPRIAAEMYASIPDSKRAAAEREAGITP